jgi:hypothetical protein
VVLHLCSKSKGDHSGTEHLASKTTLRSDNHEISKEELRRQHQAELARQKNEETARRLAGGGNEAGDNRYVVLQLQGENVFVDFVVLVDVVTS